jgi:hypothetical protein
MQESFMELTREPKNQSAADLAQFAAMEKVFDEAHGSFADKIDAFMKFASRQSVAKFLARYEIFKRIVGINGSIIECGVLHGGGLLTWAKLSAILEPTNHVRRVIGFDTFEGFPNLHDIDKQGTSEHTKVKGLTGSPIEDVERAIKLFDANRPIAHIPKIELVKGDLTKTAPQYVKDNPHLVVSLIYLDVDLYEPTKAALEHFVPLMPKGGIVVFDQLHAKIFPGETRAVDEVLGIRNVRIERFPFESYVSFAVME